MKFIFYNVVLLLVIIINFSVCNIKETEINDSVDTPFINYGMDRTTFYFIREYSFPPLLEDEGFVLEITANDDIEYLSTDFIIKTTNGRKLFKFQEKRFGDWSLPDIDFNSRYIWFDFYLSESTRQLIDYHHINPTGICVINGVTGIAKIFYLRGAHYKIDNEAKFICAYDYYYTVPRIKIYDLDTLELLTSIEYEPYRNKLMYPIQILYENNSFFVTLSADTVEFATIEIPVFGNNTYNFIDGFSFEHR